MRSPLPDFVMMFQTALLRALRDPTLRSESLRVLCYLAAVTEPKNQMPIAGQAMIAKELRMRQPSVARGIKQLVERGLLVRGPKVGRGYAYWLNPHIAWRGDGYQRADAMLSAPPLSLPTLPAGSRRSSP